MAGKFTFNTRELAAGIRRELLEHRGRARHALNAAAGYIASEAKDRAPIDEGFLTADISHKAVDNGKSWSAAIYIPSNAPSSGYAIRMHEGEYNLGPKSRERARKTGKTVGRKFITRAIDDNRDDILKVIQFEMKKKRKR